MPVVNTPPLVAGDTLGHLDMLRTLKKHNGAGLQGQSSQPGSAWEDMNGVAGFRFGPGHSPWLLWLLSGMNQQMENSYTDQIAAFSGIGIFCYKGQTQPDPVPVDTHGSEVSRCPSQATVLNS